MLIVYINQTVTEGQAFSLSYDNLDSNATRITISAQGGSAKLGDDFENPNASFLLGGNQRFARSYSTYRDGFFEGTETISIFEAGSGPNSTDGSYRSQFWIRTSRNSLLILPHP